MIVSESDRGFFYFLFENITRCYQTGCERKELRRQKTDRFLITPHGQYSKLSGFSHSEQTPESRGVSLNTKAFKTHIMTCAESSIHCSGVSCERDSSTSIIYSYNWRLLHIILSWFAPNCYFHSQK